MTTQAAALLTDLAEQPQRVLDRHGEEIRELRALRGCPQPANHHAEGDVWVHTQLALEAYADLGAAIDRHAGATLRQAGLRDLRLPDPTVTQAMAVLLHDIGKPVTIAGADDHWTYYGHDHVGAEMARGLNERLGLAKTAARMGLDLDVDAVCWLIREHLFWLNTDVERVTERAIGRRFLREDGRGDGLRTVSWCDTLGSYGSDRRPHVELMVAAEQRIASTRARAAAQAAQPQPVLNGDKVMSELGIAPGPRVGAVLHWIRRRCDDEDAAEQLLRAESDWLRDAPLDAMSVAGASPKGEPGERRAPRG